MAERRATQEATDIAFVLPHLGPGGSQRVASLLLNAWAAEGLKCTLLTTFEDPGDAHQISSAVERIVLFPKHRRVSLVRLMFRARREMIERVKARVSNGSSKRPRPVPILTRLKNAMNLAAYFAIRLRARTLRKHLKKLNPRIVISFLSTTNIMTLVAARTLEVPVVVSERNDPRRQKLVEPFETMRQRLYPEAEYVTANSQGAIDSLSAFVPEEKLHYVPNPILASARSSLDAGRRSDVFLSVGRLVTQKAHDTMIAAFARIADQLPDWRVQIAGEGPMRDALLAQAAEAGLTHRIELLGHVSDPEPLYRGASVFVLPSRYEGMPNVLLEAMCFGLPSIVSDASPAPVEMVDDGRGLVVPTDDIDRLAEAMLTLANDESARSAISDRALEHIKAYSMPKVLDIWGEMIGQSLARR